MKHKHAQSAHWSFWVMATFMLIWNVMGCINFMVQMNPEMVASYREVEQAIISDRPAWATIAFAIAVFGGALGCLLLLLRKSAAYYIFIVSFLGVMVTMAHTLGLGVEFGLGEIFGILFMPVAVAVFLIWYSKQAEKKGWISE